MKFVQFCERDLVKITSERRILILRNIIGILFHANANKKGMHT